MVIRSINELVSDMTNKVSTATLSNDWGVSTATIKKLTLEDPSFPKSNRIGRENYFDVGLIHHWLKGRASNSSALNPDDVIISGAHLLELTGRSKGWLWLNVIKPKTLTRINLSPKPDTNKLVNYFIKREVYAAFSDLIEVAKSEVA